MRLRQLLNHQTLILLLNNKYRIDFSVVFFYKLKPKLQNSILKRRKEKKLKIKINKLLKNFKSSNFNLYSIKIKKKYQTNIDKSDKSGLPLPRVFRDKYTTNAPITTPNIAAATSYFKTFEY